MNPSSLILWDSCLCFSRSSHHHSTCTIALTLPQLKLTFYLVTIFLSSFVLQVLSLQASHTELQSALVEAEKQILLWQRKIELTKELKEQLRPAEGNGESQELRLKRRCALKVLLPELSADEGCRDRFLREARAIAQIEHENVVDIYHLGDDDGSVVFFAMELLSGEDLETRLLDRARQLLRETARR